MLNFTLRICNKYAIQLRQKIFHLLQMLTYIDDRNALSVKIRRGIKIR